MKFGCNFAVFQLAEDWSVHDALAYVSAVLIIAVFVPS